MNNKAARDAKVDARLLICADDEPHILTFASPELRTDGSTCVKPAHYYATDDRTGNRDARVLASLRRTTIQLLICCLARYFQFDGARRPHDCSPAPPEAGSFALRHVTWSGLTAAAIAANVRYVISSHPRYRDGLGVAYVYQPLCSCWLKPGSAAALGLLKKKGMKKRCTTPQCYEQSHTKRTNTPPLIAPATIRARFCESVRHDAPGARPVEMIG